MSSKSVGFRPARVYPAQNLKGYSGCYDTNAKRIQPPIPAAIAPGVDLLLARVSCPHIGYPVIESLYLNGEAAGSGYLHFQVRANGVVLSNDWADSYESAGPDGREQDLGSNLPPGSVIEVWCKNEHAAVSFKAYCGGEVVTYERPI